MTVQLISANSAQQHSLNLLADYFGEKITRIQEKDNCVILNLESKEFVLYPNGEIQGYQRQFGFESAYCLTTVTLTFQGLYSVYFSIDLI